MIVSSTKTIGRNDPCHCGSGKKYKKCCLEKDEIEELARIAAEKSKIESSSMERWGNDSLQLEDDFDEFEEFDNEEEDSDEMLLDGEEDNGYPEISDEDEKLVDLWWDKYNELENPDDIGNHIEDFMNIHPHLVENLGLEHEVLFELGGDYRKADRLDEYIALLFRVKEEFSSVYIRAATYYDSDIIAWLISKGRQDEIDQYLNQLAINSLESLDQIRNIIQLCLATNNINYLPEFIEKVSDNYFNELNETLDDYSIISPLIFNNISKYFRQDLSENDIEEMKEIMELNHTSESLLLTEDFNRFWKRRIENFFRPFQSWPEHVYKKKTQMSDLYYDISNNFMRYLFENVGLSWVSSQYYGALMHDYHEEVLKNHKGTMKKMFHFSYKDINTSVINLSEDFVFVDPTKIYSLLNAIYAFVSYLELCGNIEAAEKLNIQQVCEKIFNESYSNLKHYSAETICFGQFPLFSIKD